MDSIFNVISNGHVPKREKTSLHLVTKLSNFGQVARLFVLLLLKPPYRPIPGTILASFKRKKKKKLISIIRLAPPGRRMQW